MTQPFKFFPVRVSAIQELSSGFRRFTFTDPSLASFGDPGLDQRIKLVFPIAGLDYSDLLRATDWFGAWRALPDERRYPIRTYTTRYVRADLCEIDVDVVVHGDLGGFEPGADAREGTDVISRAASVGDANAQAASIAEVTADTVLFAEATSGAGTVTATKTLPATDPSVGPASAWITQAQVGDELLILGPNADFDGEPGGIDFVPPAETERFLIAGDETAAPAIAVILEQLSPEARGIAVLEVPSADDAAYLPVHPGIEVRVVLRGDAEHGSALVAATRAAAAEIAPEGTPQSVEEIDVDTDLLWEVPRHAKGGAALKRTSLYAWLAGEAGAVKTLRRHLVSERGIDRRTIAFMGYWRIGKAEN